MNDMTTTHLAAMVGSYLSMRMTPQNVFLDSDIPEENLLMFSLAQWHGDYPFGLGNRSRFESRSWIVSKGWDYMKGAINYYRYGFPLSPGEMFKAAMVYETETRNRMERDLSREGGNFEQHYQQSGAATVIRLMRDAARSKARELYLFPCKPEALPGYSATPWIIKELPDDLAITSPVGLFSTTANRPVNQ
jgi:hypothetical protein